MYNRHDRSHSLAGSLVEIQHFHPSREVAIEVNDRAVHRTIDLFGGIDELDKRIEVHRVFGSGDGLVKMCYGVQANYSFKLVVEAWGMFLIVSL